MPAKKRRNGAGARTKTAEGLSNNRLRLLETFFFLKHPTNDLLFSFHLSNQYKKYFTIYVNFAVLSLSHETIVTLIKAFSRKIVTRVK